MTDRELAGLLIFVVWIIVMLGKALLKVMDDDEYRSKRKHGDLRARRRMSPGKRYRRA